ncbi:MAG: DinB family protein [Planctomycetota bacterium]|jgi:uncharacterized damage-inducible protein DinB
MIERTPWFQRSFDAGPPASMLPNLVERLRGTPLRLSDRLLGLAPDMLTRRHDGSWSIQENVGHLWDLEELWASRLDDFLSGKEALTPADLENQKTHIANHNDRDLYGLVAGFRLARAELIAGLEQLTATDLERTALHPRLQQPMTIPGMCHFIAEHDDHHVARVSELIRQFRAG